MNWHFRSSEHQTIITASWIQEKGAGEFIIDRVVVFDFKQAEEG
jgi:hypothetical protein